MPLFRKKYTLCVDKPAQGIVAKPLEKVHQLDSDTGELKGKEVQDTEAQHDLEMAYDNYKRGTPNEKILPFSKWKQRQENLENWLEHPDQMLAKHEAHTKEIEHRQDLKTHIKVTLAEATSSASAVVEEEFDHLEKAPIPNEGVHKIQRLTLPDGTATTVHVHYHGDIFSPNPQESQSVRVKKVGHYVLPKPELKRSEAVNNLQVVGTDKF